MRRRAGGYWTVQYAYDRNGSPIGLDFIELVLLVTYRNVGSYATRNEAFRDVVQHPEKFPPGEGKIIYTR